MKTVWDRVKSDIDSGRHRVFFPRPPAPCVICGRVQELRYGCCQPCAVVTAWDDPRVVDLPRVPEN